MRATEFMQVDEGVLDFAKNIKGRFLNKKPAAGNPPASAPQAQPQAQLATRQQKILAWFGNSQVKDKNGNPLRVYHGSPGDIDDGIFRVSKSGVYGPGIYFTSNTGVASQYATGNRRTGSGSGELQGQVTPVFLKIERPFSDGALQQNQQLRKELIGILTGGITGSLKSAFGKKQDPDAAQLVMLKNNSAKVINVYYVYNVLSKSNPELARKIGLAISNKYDGIITNYSGAGGQTGAEFVVWHPNQIKNAISG